MAIDGDNGTSTVGGGNTGYNWSGYAEWLAKTKNSTKTCNLIVNYYANGYNGSAAENPPPSSVRSYTGQSVDVRLVVEVASGDTMSNPGYIFVGWATSNNTPTVTYNPGDTISNSWAAGYRGNSVTNLYAVWTNQNVITYNPDDNSIEKSAIYQVKQSGQSATLKGATFTRTGYTQTGWATTAGGPKVYDLGGTYSSNNPLSLYPVWQANTYTITYVANEGTGTMADQTVTYDSTFTPRACSFIREGYSFSSWNESQDGKGIRWKVQEYTVDRAENITLYAIWKGNEYTVYYDDNYSRYSDEITGDIVTFESEYAQPLKKVEVSLSPIQDLHGYANPWPAGGGKNLIGLNTSPNRVISYTGVSASDHTDDAVTLTSNGNNTYAQMGLYYDLPAGTYTLSIKATSSDSFAPVVSGYKLAGNILLFNGCKEGTPKSFTLSETMAVNFRFFATASDSTARTVTFYDVQLESGSTATAWEPYENICPISGRTGVDVWDDPKYGGTVCWNQLVQNGNFADGTNKWAPNWGTYNSITTENGELNCKVLKVDGNNNYSIAVKQNKTIPENHVVLISAEFKPMYSHSMGFYFIRDSTKYPSGQNVQLYKPCTAGQWNVVSGVTKLALGNVVLQVQFDMRDDFGYAVDDVDLCRNINLYDLTQMFGSTIADYIYSLEQADAGAGVAWFRNLFPKDYYPYDNSYTETCVSAVNGDPYWKKDIDWTTQAGTVYGGTLDVVTGVLTVDRAIAEFDGSSDETWYWHNSGVAYGLVSGGFITNATTQYDALTLCDKLQPSSWAVRNRKDNSCGMYYGASYVFIRNTNSITDAATARTWLAANPITVMYPLATPLTYQLTPTQISVLTGTNNVWSDGGPITIVYALDEVPQNMPPSTAIFGDIFYTRRNQLSRFGLTFKGWNTVPDGSGEAWLPSGVSMGTYKRTEDAIWNVSHNVTLYAQWDPNVYPFGTVFFNGRNAQDLGIIVEELPSYYYAERAFNHKQVNGKNGDVILDTGRYENVKKVYKVACYDPSRNFYESAVALSTFLHSAGSDYIRLEDSYEPSSYRMAIYEETNEIENLLGKAGRCEITFNCMPQRFLLSGDEEITIPSSGYSIYNPTAFDAKPMIRIQGTGTVTINGRSVQVTENDNDMLVDCENQNAKDLSGADMNYFIYCDEFPVLKPGFNTISYTETIDAVKITPRWWIL